MVTLSQIYHTFEQQHIAVFPYAIGFACAATIEMQDRYAVFFDPSLIATDSALKVCLAHECGHCLTGATHKASSKWDMIAKHEYKANRWAIEAFLPYESLCRAAADGCCEVWQFAEYFDVTQDFMQKAITYYTGARALPLLPCRASAEKDVETP